MNPSAHAALVQGIHEGAEWVWNNGVWSEAVVEEAKRQIDAKYSEERALRLFEQLMRSLRA